MRPLEAAIIHGIAHRRVEVGNQPIRHRQPGQDRQVGFRHREGHVDLPRIAPAGDQPAMPQHQPVRPAARGDRAEDGVVRGGFEEAALDMRADIARPGRFMGKGEGCGGVEGRGRRLGLEQVGHGPSLWPRRPARQRSSTGSGASAAAISTAR